MTATAGVIVVCIVVLIVSVLVVRHYGWSGLAKMCACLASLVCLEASATELGGQGTTTNVLSDQQNIYNPQLMDVQFQANMNQEMWQSAQSAASDPIV